jgi:N-methylhydantoinase B/oxoprolinase/acetone carboxylase alpha subunit
LRFGDYRLKRNDLLRVERPGGGGWRSAQRPVQNVLDDVRQGYVRGARSNDYASLSPGRSQSRPWNPVFTRKK